MEAEGYFVLSQFFMTSEDVASLLDQKIQANNGHLIIRINEWETFSFFHQCHHPDRISFITLAVGQGDKQCSTLFLCEQKLPCRLHSSLGEHMKTHCFPLDQRKKTAPLPS